MALLALPNEILLQLSPYLKTRDLNSLLPTSHFFHELLTPMLTACIPKPSLATLPPDLLLQLSRYLNHLALDSLMQTCLSTSAPLTPVLNARIPTKHHGIILRHAAMSGNTRLAALILRKGKIDYTAWDAMSPEVLMRPLFSAACYGHTDVVRLLLQYGVDVDEVHPRHGMTAMDAAAKNGFNKPQVLPVLVEYNADPAAGMGLILQEDIVFGK